MPKCIIGLSKVRSLFHLRDSGLMQTIEIGWIISGKDFFKFSQRFFSTDFTPIYFLFFYLSHFRGCEDDLYISTQQIDGWADTLKTFNKTSH